MSNAISLTQQWQQLWQQGDRPDVQQFLAGAGDLTLGQKASLLWVDQRERWRLGERPLVEGYLQMVPALVEEPEKALELVYGEMLLREEQGEAPALAEYQERFPRYAARLAQQVELHRALAGRTAFGLDETVIAPPGARLSAPEDSGGVESGAIVFSVPGYQILGELGRGGMGVVYKARCLRLNRLIALKILFGRAQADPGAEARFHREAAALACLQHPNIVQIHDAGEAGGRHYLALELVDGGTLADKIAGKAQCPCWSARLLSTLTRAVHVAHQGNIVHRDLKPANVLLSRAGAPKVTDFGIARRLDSQADLTQKGVILGTPSYMAPEQARGESNAVGPAADVYALGAILFEMLTGQPPFLAENSVEALRQVVFREPTSPARLQPDVPRDLAAICLKCLHKEAAGRYAGAADLADDLDRFLRGEPVEARAPGAGRRVVKWARRRPDVAALLGVLLVAVVALGCVLVQWRRAEQRGDEARAALVRAEQARQDGLSQFTRRERRDAPNLRLDRGASTKSTLRASP